MPEIDRGTKIRLLPFEDQPAQEARVLQDNDDTLIVQVEPDDHRDDGLREITRDQIEPVRYLSAENLDQDDFGEPFSHKVGEVVWDAKTQTGPWATMTEKSFNQHAHKHVRENGGAQGWGQKYIRWDNGWLVKVEG